MPDLLAWPFAVLVSVFVLQYSLYVIHAVSLDRVLKLGSLFFLCTLFPYRRMTRKFGWTLALFAALFASAGVASLVMLDSTGIVQLIKVIVGFTSGGFYDRWSRLLARYVPKYIPGNPEIIVQNMPGAGGLIGGRRALCSAPS